MKAARPCGIYVAWLPPPENFVILNTDGSGKGNPGQTRAGGVARDQNGNWITGFLMHIDSTNH